MEEKKIIIKGARENNLKNIDLELPRDKFICFTGVSGSGKSTLAFDTIYAEGQRKFMESLSSYARQFLGQMQKPEVDNISGLSPVIAIDQKTTNQNPRSTVGTVTEIYDYMRLLFANIGVPYCPHCHKPIKEQSIDIIVDKVLLNKNGAKIFIKAPVVRGEKGSQEKLFENLRKSGFSRVQINNDIFELDENISLDKNKKHNISVIVDRIIVKPEIEKRVTDSIETCFKLANGLVEIEIDGKNEIFNNNFACEKCGFSFNEISPRLFSFNNPFGACQECLGLGFKKEVSKELIVKDWNKTINEGALNVNGWNVDIGSFIKGYYKALSKKYNFSLDVPLNTLPQNILDILFYGNNGEQLNLQYQSKNFYGEYKSSFEGLIPYLERRFKETTSESVKTEIAKNMIDTPCSTCHGKRLNEQALNIFINNKNITELCDLSVDNLLIFIDNLNLTEQQSNIAKNILKEMKARLNFLKNVGLDYLTLSRASASLSGGESQRIRLATQIGSGLVGVLYVLDEPSIGLHQRDSQKLIATLRDLQQLGNTLIVVEHDNEIIKSSDYIVDIGPFAGENGGKVVAQGTPTEIMKTKNSLTGQYLSGELQIELPHEKRKPDGAIKIFGAHENNLKNINVDIPLKVLTVVTGVSGSGKSSLINQTLYPALNAYLNDKTEITGKFKKIEGFEKIDKVIAIDQSPIGRTPRSNPATYTGLFTNIRDLFSGTPESKERGYTAGRFSFNIPGGRCENCCGDGIKKIEMYFLPDVYVPCEVCGGKRYNRETLKVTYKGKNIYDVLNMTIESAYKFFENLPSIRNKLQTLVDVGLGYVKLGQSSTTLSGGEAQRVKLATELARKNTGKTLYILDEPTTGLHSYDVDKLIKILQRLVNNGNTCVVIEHNLDVIKQADHIIDLGPEGGDKGGYVVASGTQEQIAQTKNSYTGQFLL